MRSPRPRSSRRAPTRGSCATSRRRRATRVATRTRRDPSRVPTTTAPVARAARTAGTTDARAERRRWSRGLLAMSGLVARRISVDILAGARVLDERACGHQGRQRLLRIRSITRELHAIAALQECGQQPAVVRSELVGARRFEQELFGRQLGRADLVAALEIA